MKKNNQKISKREKIVYMIVYLIILSLLLIIKASFNISSITGSLSLICIMMLSILDKVPK